LLGNGFGQNGSTWNCGGSAATEDDENATTPNRAANAAHAPRFIISPVVSLSLRHRLGRLTLIRLPRVQDVAGMTFLGVHRAVLARDLGRQLDDVAVGVAEVDRADELVVGDAAHLAALRLGLGEHCPERLWLDLELD